MRKFLGTLAALLTLALNACSGQALVNALTPTSGYDVHRDIAYGRLARQRLDVYTPRRITRPAPTVVFFYGGGWRDGSKDGYKFVGEALAACGFVAVIPDYRLYPQVRYPAFLEDGAAAVRWTLEHVRDYGGDPGRLFLMGHSAGAYIAAMLTLDDRFLRDAGVDPGAVRGTIGLAGPYDFLPLREDYLKDIFGPPARYASTQPVNHVSAHEPPFLLMAGKGDRTVAPRNTLHLGARLQAAGNRAKVILYPHRGHVGVIAALAAPLRFLGPELTDIAAFVRRWSAADAAAARIATGPDAGQ